VMVHRREDGGSGGFEEGDLEEREVGGHNRGKFALMMGQLTLSGHYCGVGGAISKIGTIIDSIIL
jgi:hypothetical protein